VPCEWVKTKHLDKANKTTKPLNEIRATCNRADALKQMQNRWGKRGQKYIFRRWKVKEERAIVMSTILSVLGDAALELYQKTSGGAHKLKQEKVGNRTNLLNG